MEDVDSLLYAYEANVQAMDRSLSNLKKKGKSSFTLPLLQARLLDIKQLWESCKTLDVKINKSTTSAEKKSLEYFTSNEHVAAEETYWTAVDYLTEAIAARTAPATANVSHVGDVSVTEQHGMSTPLPRIPMPTFTGIYTDWVSFRDLFDSLVIKNESISNVQKLHYLKVSIEGEASSLLKNVTITEANFQVAWDALKKRYDRSRHMVDAQLAKLFDIPAVASESIQDLKNLRDHTNEAVSALDSLGKPVDTWDELLTFMMVRKLDPCSRREWEMKIGDHDEYPEFTEISNFLEYRIRALEAIAPTVKINTQNKQTSSGKSNNTQIKSHLSTATRCCDCGGEHYVYRCEKFKEKPVEQRQRIVRDNQLCFNCLSPGHKPQQCPSKHSCHQCKKKHHTLMHDPDFQKKKGKSESSTLAIPPGGLNQKSARTNGASTPKAPEPVSTHPATTSTALHASEKKSSNSVMLATAWARLETSHGREITVRALLDQGSQSSFITESVAQILRADRTKIRATVSGIGGSEIGIGRSSINFMLQNRKGDGPSILCDAIVFQKLTSYAPQTATRTIEWPHLQGLEFADPDPSGSEPIQLILGADVYANILRDGVRRGPVGSPVAQRTILGWVLSGPTVSGEHAETTTLTAHLSFTETPLTKEIRRFWELEEVPACSPLTEEESQCETHFRTTHRRLPDGRYCVRLPFKESMPIKIGASNQIALKWLFKLETQFARRPELADPYCAFMQEYEDLEHMIPTTFNVKNPIQSVFLPHHPVIKESSTTRLRVVFNASSKTSNGTSLNDHLMVGPKLQSDLPAIILQWRTHQYAFTADLTKMYRQIFVDPDDTQYQQILWRSSPSQVVTPYRLTTVTYGTASAPYLAIRVLKQLADDEESDFPVAAPIVRNNFYVDDVLFGANDESTANSVRSELEQMLARGGFTLRKWMASHSSLIKSIPIQDRETTKCRSFDSVESIKVLGIGWIPDNDTFSFTASIPNRFKDTKRSVLSITAKLFDPLGWLAPVIIAAKIVIQELWINAAGWDDELPPALAEKWDGYYRSLHELRALSLPRWIHLNSTATKCQIHGFADASMRAYAAVLYLRVVDADNNVHVSLLIAKSKVAPIKTVSVPRLELCAATLLAKLIEFVHDTMKLTNCSTYAWTDSMVVLAWLKQHPSEWPTFVANRVANIQTRIPDVPWNHVPTDQNPADCASRGITATELCNHELWWKGPQWLQHEENIWPRAAVPLPSTESLKEKAKTQVHTAVVQSSSWNLCDNMSSWPRLLRVTAFCMRIFTVYRKIKHVPTLPLSADEIRDAKRYWIRVAQAEAFSEEIAALSSNSSISCRSSLRALNPFIDEHNILRVGGRLQHSPLSFNEKHPIILPKHRVSTLIVENAHLRSLHGGPQLTTSVLRQEYWIVGHRPFVRQLIHKCVKCTRERASVPQQLMGSLPAARSSRTRPFSHSGLDYAGPFQVRTTKGRGHKSHKAYLALFVCLATRAVHLELVSDYSSDAFLAAFRRFVSRRGLPSDLYSDNGTTFQGADKELRRSFRAVMRDAEVANTLATDSVNWHFIPPGAPHFGGLWEAGVKCTKHHLRRVIGSRTLTFEELTTLLAQIEACLNSRPIGPTSTDPDDFSSLTPGHFLIGAPLTSVPEPSVLNLNENRLSRWQLVRLILEHFWKRWSAEYVHSLQVRRKWTKHEPNLSIGDLVLVRNPNLPPSKWLLGRITACHPGNDNRVRVVTVKTAQSEFKRPIAQLCVLPVDAALSNSRTDSSSSTDPEFEDCDETGDLDASVALDH